MWCGVEILDDFRENDFWNNCLLVRGTVDSGNGEDSSFLLLGKIMLLRIHFFLEKYETIYTQNMESFL